MEPKTDANFIDSLWGLVTALIALGLVVVATVIFVRSLFKEKRGRWKKFRKWIADILDAITGI